MNPRILKKLSKRSASIIDRLGICKNKRKVLVGKNNESVETCISVEPKYLERWGGKLNKHGYFVQLKGTVGFGRVAGYYEPEWEDMDAYSILRQYVMESFTEWDSFEGEGWPHNSCPESVYATPSGILKHAEFMAQREGSLS